MIPRKRLMKEEHYAELKKPDKHPRLVLQSILGKSSMLDEWTFLWSCLMMRYWKVVWCYTQWMWRLTESRSNHNRIVHAIFTCQLLNFPWGSCHLEHRVYPPLSEKASCPIHYPRIREGLFFISTWVISLHVLFHFTFYFLFYENP